MFAERRRQLILRRVARDGSVKVAALAREWQVNPITVRRDLAVLAEQKLIRRVHGGAAAVDAAEATMLRIGLMVPHTQYYYGKVITGAERAAQHHGVRLVLAAYFHEQALEHERLERLSALELDGLVLTSSGLSGVTTQESGRDPHPVMNDDFVAALLDRVAMPTVFLERHFPQRLDAPEPSIVRSAHDRGTVIALHHLHRLGHRKILVLMHPTATSSWIRQGIDSAVAKLDLDVTMAPYTLRTRARDVRAAARLCRDTGIRAILAHPDDVGSELVDELDAVGLNVPEDVHLITYDDEIAHLCRVPLTAIAPAKEALGYEAVRAVIDQIDSGTSAPPRQVILTPQLVIRNSAPACPG